MYLKLALIGVFLISTSICGQVIDSGDIVSHIDSIITTIPGEDAGDMDKYSTPNTTADQQWRQIVQDILDEDYASANTTASSLEYRVVEFTDNTTVPGRVYYILEMTPGSTANYWGTYVFNPNPSRSKLVIQAPHPLQNRNTGEQGFRVFKQDGAWVYCLAGTHKCNSSSYTPCAGTSTSCSETAEPYRNCDQAHIVDGTFQAMTEELLAVDGDLVIIQPHGFTMESGDPHLVMSNGTKLTPTVDYLPTLRDNLLNQDNSLTFKIAHIDTDWDRMIGVTNVQGRLVNGVADPCSQAATSTTGQFIHLEQAWTGLRDTEANWQKLVNAVALTFPAEGEVVTAQSGEWLDVNTWVGGVVPTSNDDVVIAAGHTISIDDASPECHSMTFGDTASHIDMNADSRLTVYGDFTLFSEEHNVFSAGWSGTDAKIVLAGAEPTQTLSGWSTTGGSTSFRDLVIDKDAGTVVSTAGNGMRFAVQNSLEIIGGEFILAADDNFEARWASSGNLTDNQNLEITVQADGVFTLVDGDGTHWIRSNTGSTPIGKMTVSGTVVLTDGSSSDISIADIDVLAGGTLEIGTGLYSSSYGPELNPGTITIDSGGIVMCLTSSDVWFDSAAVVINPGGEYRTTATTTVFPEIFTNNGKVRYQRDISTTSDQTLVDMDYFGVECSFDGDTDDSRKLWELADNRTVGDSLTINNSADLVISALSPYTLTVDGTVRLTSGTIDNSDANVLLAVGDGAWISRATGEITSAPSFVGSASVKYSSSSTSVTTGPELPTSASALDNLTIYSSGQVVTLGADATVNGDLTLSLGSLDNDGDEDDFTLTMADGSTIRRATGELTVAPAFAAGVNVEYISTVSHVTTGFELPTGASTLNDLTVTGDEGVTLGADVTVNGILSLNGSDLITDTYTVTLAEGASIVEDAGFTVRGNLASSATMAQSIEEDFGGIGVELTASGDAPGATTVLRVTGEAQDVNGTPSVLRYFDITPSTNAGLAATMVFHYGDTELNGIAEDSLSLFSSVDGGATWSLRGGVVDPVENTVTLSGINGFSRWTLSGASLEGLVVSAQSGSWTDPATWQGGNLPTSTDDIYILAGHTVSVDDEFAECAAMTFGGNDALIDMNARGLLTVYGDVTLYSEEHNVFSAGWSSDSAFIKFAGGAEQTLSGWSTTGGSTSLRDVIIAKDSGTVVTTAGTGMRLALQNSLDIVTGKLILAADDDLEARWASSGNHTNNQDLTITVGEQGEFLLVDGDGTHFIRSGVGSQIGRMTVFGQVEFYDASSYDIHIAGIDIKACGEVKLGTGMYSSTYGPEFNPGTITVDSGASLHSVTSSDIWFDSSAVILNRGGVFKAYATSTVFAPTFVNDGKVRYQRDASTTSDQTLADIDYYDVECSFDGDTDDSRKLWDLAGDRIVADSLIVNNSADLVLSSASAAKLTVAGTLRLTSGSLDNSDANVTLELADAGLISVATGSITNAPDFTGVADVRYTSSAASMTTGPELPTATDILRDLTIFSSDQTVTLNANATVNGDLTLSAGIFDNNGASDDKVLTMANEAVIRRATGELTAAPTFGSVVDVAYISTVGAVTTGPELPTSASVLRDLTISGNQGVTLGADVTVNGTLALQDSILTTGAHAVTLASAASIVEDSIWVVQGTVRTTRTMSQSTPEAFGGLGIGIAAVGAAPGATTVARVTGVPQAVGGAAGIARYFSIAAATNSGLDATVTFSYADRELNGLAEADLTLYESTNGGSSWSTLDGAAIDTVLNTVTIAGLSSLGWYTLGQPQSGCCTGPSVGNVDGSPDNLVTMGDLTVLIDHLFISLGPLACVTEGNVDMSGDGLVTMGDLTVLIDHLFISLNPLSACP